MTGSTDGDGHEEITDTERVEQWAETNKISGETVKLLFKDGFTSMEAVELLELADLEATKIPRGQRKLVMKAVTQLQQRGRSGSPQAQQPPHAPSGKDATSAAKPTTSNQMDSQHIQAQIASQSGDGYVREVLGSLRQEQAAPAEIAQAFGINLTSANVRPSDSAISRNKMAAPMTPNITHTADDIQISYTLDYVWVYQD